MTKPCAEDWTLAIAVSAGSELQVFFMSEMPGQRELLNICFACLRYSRVAQTGLPLVKPANLSNVFLRGGTQCSHCRFASSSSQGSAGVEEAQGIQADVIENNPFYEKYKQKLQHLATYVLSCKRIYLNL